MDNPESVENNSFRYQMVPSAIAYLVSEEPPPLRPASAAWMVGTPVLLAAVLSIVAYVDVLNSLVMLCLLFVISLLGLALIWHLSNSWDQTLQTTIYLIEQSRGELTNLREQLSEYLHRLHDRVRRHFNSVDTTKTEAYITLLQLNNALGERLNLVSQLIVHGTNQGLITTYRCLQQPLEFNTSLRSDSAKRTSVPMNELERFILQLIDELETILIAIESEEEQIKLEPDQDDNFKPI